MHLAVNDGEITAANIATAAHALGLCFRFCDCPRPGLRSARLYVDPGSNCQRAEGQRAGAHRQQTAVSMLTYSDREQTQPGENSECPQPDQQIGKP